MGTISTGVGLVSGIDSATLIEQLIALEARGKVPLQQRVSKLTAQQTAMLDINARLLNFANAVGGLRQNDVFRSATATSSNESVLTARATTDALPGTATFLVRELAAAGQIMTRGFADRDQSALGLDSLSFEFGRGRLSADAELASLNGGEGVRRGTIRITDAAGAQATVDLSDVATVDEALERINAADVAVRAFVDGDRLAVEDLSGGGGTLLIEDGDGSFTATDLGLATADGGAGDADGLADGVIRGAAVNRLASGTALASLNDGNGVLVGTGLDVADFRITTRDGVTHDVVLGPRTVDGETEPAVTTLQGVIDRIEASTGGAVTAAIAADGVGLTLTDTTGGAGLLQVTGGVNGTGTARDLGLLEEAGVASDTLEGERLLAGINTRLLSRLNGGGGLGGATTLSITDRAGATFTMNTLESFESLDELIDAVNAEAEAQGVAVVVALNDAGNGLSIADSSGGAGNLLVQGDAATALHLETDPAGVASDTFRGGNLQHQYVSEATPLDELNFGRGVSEGTFRVTDANGGQATVEITSSMKTVQDVLAAINSKGLEINARVNDSGDGILIEDTSVDGTLGLRVERLTGAAAKDLGILGEASDPETSNVIDGSYERVVDLETTDTLDEVIAKINDAGLPVTASVLNAGAGGTPYRMVLTSAILGSRGAMTVDAGGVDLGLATLTEARDGRVFFGSTDPANAILLTTDDHTLDDVLEGVEIDLKSAGDGPVTLTVARNTQAVVDAVKSIVTTFNDVVGRINQYDKYDQETETRGPLLGDPTVARLRSALYRTLQEPAQDVDSTFSYLVEIGISVGNEKGELTFDETKFREAYESDPAGVEALLTARESDLSSSEEIFDGVTVERTSETFTSLGIAEKFKELAESFTSSVDGVLKNADENFTRLIDAANERIEAFDARLERRRETLRRQFAAMEETLAQLQGQQGALQQLAAAATTASLRFA